MKKAFLLGSLIAAFAISPVLGQGYFLFTAPTARIWTDWLPGGPQVKATNNVAFLFGSGTPAVDAFMTSTPTDDAVSVNLTVAWNDILTDLNFMLATNDSTHQLAWALNAPNGSFSYGTATFPVTGTSSTGGSTTVFVIAWFGLYTTPQAAAAAGAPVGWSAPFSYTYGSSIGTPLDFSSSGLQPFGLIPEPSTLALAALGGLSLLLCHRRK